MQWKMLTSFCNGTVLVHLTFIRIWFCNQSYSSYNNSLMFWLQFTYVLTPFHLCFDSSHSLYLPNHVYALIFLHILRSRVWFVLVSCVSLDTALLEYSYALLIKYYAVPLTFLFSGSHFISYLFFLFNWSIQFKVKSAISSTVSRNLYLVSVYSSMSSIRSIHEVFILFTFLCHILIILYLSCKVNSPLLTWWISEC